MDSSNWLKILENAAKHVYVKVSEARVKRELFETIEFKNLLDKTAQHAIIESLNGTGISCSFVSEEGDTTIGSGGSSIVITDPIDGTTNLAWGLQPAVTCISYSETSLLSDSIAAVVMDLYSGDTYTAEKSKGARLNGKPIKPCQPRVIRRSLLSLDISKNLKLERIGPLLYEAQYIRMLGSSAMDICHVASGVFDAHIDIRGSLRGTDVAAGLMILKEAGGVYAVNGVRLGELELAKETNLELIASSCNSLMNQLLELTRESM